MTDDRFDRDEELARAIARFVESEDAAGRLEGLGELPAIRAVTSLGPGSVLGEFELTRRMAAGGMGVVFEARQRSMGNRMVAVKVLRSVLRSERTVRRFQREIDAVARLDHPGIVPVLSSGVEHEVPYFAMRLVEGVPLHEVLRGAIERHGAPPSGTHEIREAVRNAVDAAQTDSESGSGNDERWSTSYVRWVARVGADLAAALQHAHTHGVVHRDVKPANVVITPNGRPVLLDFGLAVQEDDDTLTETGQFLGTLAYVSPEQAHGEDVDGRSDVWSLGAVLYELLAFRRPFEGTSRADLLRRLDRDDPPPLSKSIPRDLRTIVQHALERDPDRRCSSAEELAADLTAFLEGAPIRARPLSPLLRARRAVLRHPWSAGVAAAIVFLFVTMRVRDGVLAAGELREANATITEFTQASAELHDRRANLVALLADPRARSSSRSMEIQRERERLDETRERTWGLFAAAEAGVRRSLDYVAEHDSGRRSFQRLYEAGLALSLAEHDDLLNSARLASLQGRLRSTAPDSRWLDDTGSISLTVEPEDAVVRIHRDGSETKLLLASRPPIDLALPEGSYLARVEAPGHETVTLPFLVRRSTCYDVPGALPPRALQVVLPEAGTVPAGYVHVPAGWTLVADDPPRWEYVEDFQIRQDEVSARELVDWMNAIGVDEGATDRVPRNPFDQATKLLRLNGGRWSLAFEGQAGLPVRGIAPLGLKYYATQAIRFDGVEPTGWYTALPTVAQWTRAARGADARAYPWGDAFSWQHCAGYPSTGEGIHEPNPVHVDAFPSDRSPFGVHALAGSMRELTSSYFEGTVDRFSVCGGSYRSATPDEVRTTRRVGTLNVPHWDLGLRVVRQRIPVELMTSGGTPAPFFDAFGEKNGTTLEPWIPSIGEPLFETMVPDHEQGVWLQEGRLVLRSRPGGNYASKGVRAYRPVRVGPAGGTYTITLRGRAEWSRTSAERGLGLALQEALGRPDVRRVHLGLGVGGRLRFEPEGEACDTGLDPSEPFLLELRVRGADLEGRAWPSGATRPVRAQATTRATGFAPTHLYLSVSSLIGCTLRVEDVRLALD